MPYFNFESELMDEPLWLAEMAVELPRPLRALPQRHHYRHPRPQPLPNRQAHSSLVCQVLIPETYQRLPILSRLVSRFGVMVNILGAWLSPPLRPAGEFVLSLTGTPPQQASCLAYLRDLQVTFLPHQPIETAAKPWFDTTQGRSKPLPLAKGRDRLRVQLCIPVSHHSQPVLSRVIQSSQVAVSILSASLPSHGQQEGWFELDIWGLPRQLELAVNALNQANCDLWLLA